MQTIKVAIIDDHQIIRQGLALIIGSYPEIDLLTESENGAVFLDWLRSSPVQPNVVILDLKMPVLDGIETTKILAREFPAIKILILTMVQQEDFILHLLDIGAHGFLLKNTSSGELKDAIVAVHEKGVYFNDRVSAAMLSGLKKKWHHQPKLDSKITLTPREQEVLELICREFTMSEIAHQHSVSTRTVETHRKNIMTKLGAKNTADIIYRAIRERLIVVE